MSRRAGLDPQMVVQAAAEMVDRDGLEALTLAALAAHFKVAVPSLYNHVGGMPGLQHQLALLGRKQFVQVLGKAVMGKAGDDAIMALAAAYRGYVKAHPGVYACSVRVAEADDTESRMLETEAVEIMLKVLEHYDVHDEQAIHLVRGFRSIVHGFVTLELAGGFGIPLSLDESFRLLVQGYIRSFAAAVQ